MSDDLSSISRAMRWLTRELGLTTMRSAGKDVYILILCRFLRLCAYGTIALIIALYFVSLNISDAHIGLFMTLTLLGDTLISLLLTLVADRLGRRNTLLLGSLMMVVSGIVFATTENYAALLAAAIVGVVSPSGNEIGPFRAIEESTLAHLVRAQDRADVFTWYVVLAVVGSSTGLAVGGLVVDGLAGREGWTELDAYRALFWGYAGVGVIKGALALCLSARCEMDGETSRDEAERRPLLNGDGPPSPEAVQESASKSWRQYNLVSSISKHSQAILLKLCSLFVLDSLGSGLAPFSLVNYYLERKFTLEKGKLGGIMSATWFVSTIGNIFASSLAKRLGLIQAMVATHLPSSMFLAFLPVPRQLSLTICLLVGRSVLSSMDQAPRSAFLSLVVLPDERTAVMGIVNIVKTLSQSAGPWVTGVLAGHDHFWVAFVAAGSIKAAYDIALLALFAGRVHERKDASPIYSPSANAERGSEDTPTHHEEPRTISDDAADGHMVANGAT